MGAAASTAKDEEAQEEGPLAPLRLTSTAPGAAEDGEGATSTSGSRSVNVLSCDGVKFEIEARVARESSLLQAVMEADGGDAAAADSVPLSYVSSATLQLILTLYRAADDDAARVLASWNADQWCRVLLSADYLAMGLLFSCMCDNLVAAIARCNSLSALRKLFGIQGDLSDIGERIAQHATELLDDKRSIISMRPRPNESAARLPRPAAAGTILSPSSDADAYRVRAALIADTLYRLATSGYEVAAARCVYLCRSTASHEGLCAAVSRARDGPHRLTHLMASYYTGDVHRVQWWLKLGADVNAKTPKGRTLLSIECEKVSKRSAMQASAGAGEAEADADAGAESSPDQGHGPMLMLLLDGGADVSAKDENGSTPLHMACSNGHDALVALLLERGADANAKDENGSTPLHVACSNRHDALVALLLERGADANAKDRHGYTPLRTACHRCNVPAVLHLLNHHGADLSLPDNLDDVQHAWELGQDVAMQLLDLGAVDAKTFTLAHGMKPLWNALCSSHLTLAARLLDLGADVNVVDGRDTPLMRACANGLVELAVRLINMGAAVNAVGYSGETALHIACERGQASTALCLLNHGANVHAQDRHSYTPLHHAAMQGLDTVALRLLELGADLNAKDEYGQTPVYHACLLDRGMAVLTLLLDRGADIHDRAGNGQTLLHLACGQGVEATATMLLDRGAAINAKRSNGDTPLHVACLVNESLALQLLDRGADATAANTEGVTPLHAACDRRFEAVALRLLECGADPRAADSSGRTPLHIAVEHGLDDLVMRLIELGADVNAKRSNGATPLHVACTHKREAIAMRLLDRGADLLARDSEDHTPLYAACCSRCESLALLLMDRGASANAADSSEAAALSIACRGGCEAVVARLLEGGAAVHMHIKEAGDTTVLHWACGLGLESAALRLVDAGADVNARDTYGRTPMDDASGNRYPKLAQLVLEHAAVRDAARDAARAAQEATATQPTS